MPIRNQAKISSASIVPAVRLDLNPFTQRQGTARLLRNWIPEHSRIMRKPFSPGFQTNTSGSTGSVQAIVDFRFHRSNAAESQLLIFRSNGLIYRRIGGAELEIFPGATAAPFAALNSKPTPITVGNRLFFSDLSNAYVYDGRSFRKWGISRQAGVPTLSVVAGPGLTAASGMTATFTWVVLDEAGNRVHESSRSNVPAISAALANQKLRIDVSAFTAPANSVTHWSGYASELDGSAIRRRTNTTAITTTTFDVAAFPAGTNPIEPIRNDPPSPSIVMGAWKNRIAMRDENDPRNNWFTAFGEVISTLAGSESESVPGKDASSVSDLVNEFSFPDKRIKLYVEHDNALYVFTDYKGYVIAGSGGVLDSAGSRELVSAQQFSEGAAGLVSGCSTPFGLAWMTPGRKLNLWPGGRGIINIGDPLKPQLDTIQEADISTVQLLWWDGNGRKWLIITCKCADSDNLTGSVSWRIFVYDFDAGTEPDRPGEWFEWTDITYSALGTYMNGDQRFLLAGADDAIVYQLDTISNPAHLNRSMILGKTYLGTAIQNNAAATLRTGLLIPNNDQEATGLYVGFVKGSQVGPSTTVGANPAVAMALDPINPDSTPGISLTPGAVKESGEYLTWLMPESGGTEGGALGKQFQFQLSYPAGSSNNSEADGRLTVAVDTIYKTAFSYQIQGDLK